MHLSLHKKAYRDILLIANGHEIYKNDLSKFVQNIHHIDIYSDDEIYNILTKKKPANIKFKLLFEKINTL